jgi:hypothetical protein
MISDDAMRNTVEEHLDEQAEILSSVRTLIEERVPFDEWDPVERNSLLLALAPTDGNSFETMKASALSRHLFRTDIEVSSEAADGVRPDLAERIRADLAGLVRLGAGRHIASAVIEAASIPPRLRS